MIDPARILYYFENVALLIDTDAILVEPENESHKKWCDFHKKNIAELLKDFYKFCHIGTQHKCQHPDWEALFIEREQKMIDDGLMKLYKDRA